MLPSQSQETLNAPPGLVTHDVHGLFALADLSGGGYWAAELLRLGDTGDKKRGNADVTTVSTVILIVETLE